MNQNSQHQGMKDWDQAILAFLPLAAIPEGSNSLLLQSSAALFAFVILAIFFRLTRILFPPPVFRFAIIAALGALGQSAIYRAGLWPFWCISLLLLMTPELFEPRGLIFLKKSALRAVVFFLCAAACYFLPALPGETSFGGHFPGVLFLMASVAALGRVMALGFEKKEI